MKKGQILSFLLIGAALLPSCNLLNNLVHDDQVVAKAAGKKLYRSELSKYIPDTVSPADSASMADQYINSWATNLLFTKKAERELSKEEQEMDKELQDYRASLLKYRYEQLYINARLDTTISAKQIEDYYNAHKESFGLVRPILKVRFINILKDSQHRGEILDKLSARGGSEQQDLDSLAFVSSIRYVDNSEQWIDAALLAREFATDYETMLSHLVEDYIVIEREDRGDIRAAYVFDIIRSGTAPLDFCSPLIKDNIISARKRDLLEKLEQDLLTDAREHKDFVKFGK